MLKIQGLIGTVLLLGSCTTTPVDHTQSTSESVAAFALGMSAFSSAQYASAYNYFAQAEAAAPENPNYEMHTALALMSLERFEEAESKLASACSKKIDFPECWNNFSVFYIKTKRPTQALKYTAKAIASKHYQTPEVALANQARALIDLRRYPEAIKDLQKAERIGVNNCNIHLLKAKAFSRQKLYDLALESTDRAESICLSDSRTHFWKVYLLQKNRRTDMAAERLRSMLETFRDEKTIHETKQQLSQINKKILLKEPLL